MIKQSGLYCGNVRHRRFSPVSRAFNYTAFMLYAKLDELPQIFNSRGFWSFGRSLVRFNRNDYLPGKKDLRESVLSRVEDALGERPKGAVSILTNPRIFGFLVNPITVFYCFEDEDATQLQAVLLEVTNTPWGERQEYVLACDPTQKVQRIRFNKAMHVSPFMPMQQRYELRLSRPADSLQVHLSNLQDDKLVFDATLALKKREINTATKWRVLFEYPWMTLKVIAAIYWQAIKILMSGVPFYSHPDKGKAL
jgi:DUF1365 family protein